MMDLAKLEEQLAALPLYFYGYIDPKRLEFSSRIRYICGAECPMYNTTWACPPAVGEVEDCRKRCLGYDNCLMIGNDRQTDILGAKSAGLDTLYMHTNLTPADQREADPALSPEIADGDCRHFEFEGSDWEILTKLILSL